MAESASLYRRHRPQSFAEVVGQEHIVRTLSNAIESDRVHHAYLFVGSRGTGKTSMAKILARSLNCVQGPTLTPCGECEPCRAIAAGSSMDVIEMDAASNRSVDDIRELRERVGYAPAEGRYKVYILDEAHMLTKEAWNAFLKTLEEPPPNTVFVLATTEPQKVMATIVDRCQRFDFQRPALEQIGEVVQRVAGAESIEIDDGAVALIARSASGSFRDALGTLDQLTAFGGSRITTDDVVQMLGAADADLLFDATDAVAAGDARGVLGAVERLASSGRDPGQFARDLVAHLRQLLVARATGEVPESFTVTVAQPERLAEQAGKVADAQLVGAIDALSAAVAAMREGDDPRLSLEVALLKVAKPSLDPTREALLRRIERLEGRLAAPGQTAAPATPPDREPTDRPPAPEQSEAPPDSADAGEPVAAEVAGPEAHEGPELQSAAERAPGGDAPPAPDAAEPPSDPEPAERPSAAGPDTASAPDAGGARSATPDLAEVVRLWPAVIEHIRQSGAEMLASLLTGAGPIGIEPERSRLRVAFPAEAKFNKRKAEDREAVKTVAEAIGAIVGVRLNPAYELTEQQIQTPQTTSGEPELAEEEVVALIKSSFDAEEVLPDPEASGEDAS